MGIEILKILQFDTFKKLQLDVNFIDLDSKLVDLNYKVASLIFCHFWRSIYNVESASPIINAVSVFRPFSTRYFGICQFFVRYCSIGHPPMSPSLNETKPLTFCFSLIPMYLLSGF